MVTLETIETSGNILCENLLTVYVVSKYNRKDNANITINMQILSDT